MWVVHFYRISVTIPLEINSKVCILLNYKYSKKRSYNAEKTFVIRDLINLRLSFFTVADAVKERVLEVLDYLKDEQADDEIVVFILLHSH